MKKRKTIRSLTQILDGLTQLGSTRKLQFLNLAQVSLIILFYFIQICSILLDVGLSK